MGHIERPFDLTDLFDTLFLKPDLSGEIICLFDMPYMEKAGKLVRVNFDRRTNLLNTFKVSVAKFLILRKSFSKLFFVYKHKRIVIKVI